MAKLSQVESSLIDAIGYDTETQELTVKFKRGGVFAYEEVPKDTFQAFLNAESIGRYFLAHIKHKFNYRKEA